MISLHKCLKKLEISALAAQGDLNAAKASKRIPLLQFNAVLKALRVRPGTSRAHNKLCFQTANVCTFHSGRARTGRTMACTVRRIKMPARRRPCAPCMRQHANTARKWRMMSRTLCSHPPVPPSLLASVCVLRSCLPLPSHHPFLRLPPTFPFYSPSPPVIQSHTAPYLLRGEGFPLPFLPSSPLPPDAMCLFARLPFWLPVTSQPRSHLSSVSLALSHI